jgi:hypothetical protein
VVERTVELDEKDSSKSSEKHRGEGPEGGAVVLIGTEKAFL